MRKNQEEYLSGSLVAMIDVVFQLIIFFVVVVAMQDARQLVEIDLAMSPNGAPVKEKDPREVVVWVSKSGTILVQNTPMSAQQLYTIMKKVAAETRQQAPIVIRADARATHNQVRQAMDACAEAGMYKIKLAALKEKNT
jgi:biopolymer transport protein ExbD